jgi:hypothetical protein
VLCFIVLAYYIFKNCKYFFVSFFSSSIGSVLVSLYLQFFDVIRKKHLFYNSVLLKYSLPRLNTRSIRCYIIKALFRKVFYSESFSGYSKVANDLEWKTFLNGVFTISHLVLDHTTEIRNVFNKMEFQNKIFSLRQKQ